MSNLKLSYQNIIDKTGIEDRPYQRDFLTNPIYQIPNKPIVLGAGTSSGKTIMAILKLIMFYKNRNNKNKQSLVIPAFHEILRDNFMEQLYEVEKMYGKLPFSYIEIKGKNTNDKIKKALKDGINVIICLPQTTFNNVLLFKNKIEWLYFDEAQYFYLAKMCQDLIKAIKPSYQLLMTGSVAKYNSNKHKFIIKYVSVNELNELGLISNPKIELIQSSYNLKDTDYTSMFGKLKNDILDNKNKNIAALYSVAKNMISTLPNPFMKVTTNKQPIKKMLRVYGEIGKTIMICHSIPQAKCFYEILNKELKGRVLISHSKTDKEDWDNFNKFKTDNSLLLIVVNQGRIGFSMKELCNIVDFSMSKDFEMLQQIVGRLLRKSDKNPNQQKIYYKVSTVDLAKWYEYVMKCVMCLMHIDWYSTYTGNKNQFKFPRLVKQRNQSLNKSKVKSISKSNNFKEFDEFPLDLNYVNYVNQNMQSDFATYAWWTLKDAILELSNKSKLSYEDAKRIVHTQNIKTITDYIDWVQSNSPNGILSYPDKAYDNFDWSDYLGNKIISTTQRGNNMLSYDEAKKYIKPYKLKTQKEYIDWYNDNKEILNFLIPRNPGQKYKKEFIGMRDYLGNNVISHNNKQFLSFNKAKKFVRNLKLDDVKSWKEWYSKNTPNNIPSNPNLIYKKEWISFPDWIGNSKQKSRLIKLKK